MNINENKKIVDYFAYIGLNNNNKNSTHKKYPDIDADKLNDALDPIVDLCIIDKSLNEKIPHGYECILQTPYGNNAHLNSGTPRLYLCFRRGYDRPPISDIGILYEGSQEKLLDGCGILKETFYGSPSYVSNNSITGTRTYITYRRALDYACNSLATVDICVLIKSKNEQVPHSFKELDKNLNCGLLGASIYLCYKKALIPAKHIKYQPELLFRYPLDDYDDFSFPHEEQVSNFGLPQGATLELWPLNKQNTFSFSSFVLNTSNDTSSHVHKVYASCLIFYEKYNQENLNDEQIKLLAFDQEKHELYTNKCILLLSRYPFFDAFNQFLEFIYNQTHTKSDTCAVLPIERYISHFIHLNQFPSIQKPHVLINLTHTLNLSVYLHEETILPQSGASFIDLVYTLDSEASIQVLLYALLQKNIMIHSLRATVLTGVVEALACIIFPFIWKYNYIPMCPLNMYHMIDAPVSFIYGMDSRYFDIFDIPKNVICVDLDTKSIAIPSDTRHLTIKILPRRAVHILKSRLDSLRKEIDVFKSLKNDKNTDKLKLKKRERYLELSIREAFIHFMARILHQYKEFFRAATRRPDTKALDRNLSTYYNCDGFISVKRDSQEFYRELVRTQLFYDFIINVSFISELDTSLVDSLQYFDNLCFKIDPHVDSKDDNYLLKLSNNLSDQTIVVLPPECNENQLECKYTKFPDTLDASLFSSDYSNSDTLKAQSCLSVGKMNVSFIPRTPTTPIGRRTEPEKLKSQTQQIQIRKNDKEWAYCLLSNAYALWFIHLPSFVNDSNKIQRLNYAYKVLIKMQKQFLQQPDEICYRVLMQLCLVYKLATLAVKILLHMRKYKIKIDPITLSFYNKCTIEGTWPSFEQDKWGKLRAMINAIKAFKYNLKLRKSRLAYERKLALIEAKKSKLMSKTTLMQQSTNNRISPISSNTHKIQSSSSQSCSLSSITEPDKISVDKLSRDESIDSGAYLAMDPSDLSNKKSKTRDELALIRKNTLKFDQKMKSKTMIVRKSMRLSRYKYSQLICIHDVGNICIIYDDQMSLFTQNININDDQIEFELRKYRSSDDIFHRYQNKLYKNLKRINENLKKSFLVPKTNIPVVIDPLGAYLQDSSHNQSPIQNDTIKKENELFNYNPFNLELNHQQKDQQREQQCICQNDSIDDESNGDDGDNDDDDDDEFNSTEDDDDEDNDEEEDDEEKNEASLNNSSTSGSIKPLTGALFSLVGRMKTHLEQKTNIKQMHQYTQDKLSELKNKLPVSISQQDLKHKIKSLSTYTMNNASNLLNQSGYSSTTNSAKSTPVNANNKNNSNNSISGCFNEDTHMPESYDPPEDLFTLFTSSASNSEDTLIHIDMSSCNFCSKCQTFLYDEDIMSQWSPSDSDYYTKCIYCKDKLVPYLYIRLKRLDMETNKYTQSELTNVNYLSPFVLRKELENIMDNNQLSIDSSFIQKHNIYWNLLWYFNRLELHSQLPILLLNSFNYQTIDLNRVRVVCYWDEFYHRDEFGEPLYLLWNKLNVNSLLPINDTKYNSRQYNPRTLKKLMTDITNSIKKNDMLTPFRTLLRERDKTKPCTRSIYREILYLSIVALNREQIDIDAFDREFRKSLKESSQRIQELLKPIDKSPNNASIWCRRLFKPLFI